MSLAGFGGDYGGVVTDWGGGALDSALGDVKLYLDPGSEQYQSAPSSQVRGDQDYSSSLKPMQQMNPKVSQIFVDFEQPCENETGRQTRLKNRQRLVIGLTVPGSFFPQNAPPSTPIGRAARRPGSGRSYS